MNQALGLRFGQIHIFRNYSDKQISDIALAKQDLTAPFRHQMDPVDEFFRNATGDPGCTRKPLSPPDYLVGQYKGQAAVFTGDDEGKVRAAMGPARENGFHGLAGQIEAVRSVIEQAAPESIHYIDGHFE